MHVLLLSLLFSIGVLVLAQGGQTPWTAFPFNPVSYPLAVKTPYVSAWYPPGNGPMSHSWPESQSFTPMGWFSIITVDGKAYQLMGSDTNPPMDSANQTAITITPTRTSILFEAGPVIVNVTYLSPVEPHDLVQQSLPFSYYYLSFTSNATHAIGVYCDITGEWMTGDNSVQSNWNATDEGSVVYLQTQLSAPSPFEELNNRPKDGIAYLAMLQRSGLSWQIGLSGDMRGLFANGTGLNNSINSDFHPVEHPFDSIAIAADLGTVQSSIEPIVWAVGVMRDPVVQFTDSRGKIQELNAFYRSNISSLSTVFDVHTTITDVLDNFDNALNSAIALDSQILRDGSKISGNYYDLLALSTRQAMGAVDFTVGQDSAGNWNTSDVKAFLRNAGGIGSGRVNAVDIIYAASPIYLYLNPEILGYLLRPLLEYQESSMYTNLYAAIHIGTLYSQATGINDEHIEGIEQSGNMLIMTYAHAQRTGDTSLLTQHYNLLRGWADYLVDNSLAPGSQVPSSSDGVSAVNQTNLSLKGIIGVAAMAKISSVAGQNKDFNRFQNVASSYARQWQELALSSNQSHVTTQYGQDGAYSLLYNLYAHKLLQLDLLPNDIFHNQTAFYKSQLDSTQYGLPLDSNNTSISRSDWMLFTAAIASDTTVRDALIDQVHAYASGVKSKQPFNVVYNPLSGKSISGTARSETVTILFSDAKVELTVDIDILFLSPAQGAMFALLALDVPIKLVDTPGSHSTKRRSINEGPLIGGVIGGVAVAVGLLCLLHHRYITARRTNREMQENNTVNPLVFPSNSGDELQTSTSQHTKSQPSAHHIPAIPVLHNVLSFLGYPQSTSAIREKQGDMADRVQPERRDGPDLRREVEVLRREVELMRQDREDAPPLYDGRLEEESGI